MQTFEEKLRARFARKRAQPPSGNSLYFLLYEAIKEGILGADIPQDSALLPSRRLAGLLGISRSTVLKAYELLTLEGYIEARQGSGYRVKRLETAPEVARPRIDREERYPALSELGHAFMANVGQLNTTDDKSIGFRPGLPPLDIFPVHHWKNLSNAYWRYITSSALSYSPSSGNEQLKKNLVTYLNLSRGIRCESAQIIIVSGSLQSLYLLGSVIMDAGDTVLVEDPTFPNVKSIFSSLRTRMKGIPVDEQGLQTQWLDHPDHRAAKLLHLTPSHHYPLGGQMSIERRKAVLDWSRRQNAFIIENDYEHEVNNYSQSMPSLYSLDDSQRTIFLGTFNRLLHPSIRIGYMVVPPYLLEAVEALLKHSHRFVAPSIQVVLNQFIEKKLIYGHIKKVVAAAEQRQKVFRATYQEVMGSRFPLLPSNGRSLHLMASLPGDRSDREITHRLAQKHILAHPLSKCHLQSETASQGLIFGYSSVRPPVIQQKLKRMATVLAPIRG